MTTPADRVAALNAAYDQGHGNSRDILRADFGGDWPPKGLIITREPDHAVRFQSHFSLGSTVGFVENTDRDLSIHMNRQHMLERIFTRASGAVADTISHENVHILQKTLIRQGVADPFGRGGSRSPVNAMVRDNAGSIMRDLATADEIQARLHLIVSHHYRRYKQIPLAPVELSALLDREGVILDRAYKTEIMNTPAGRDAFRKFPDASYPKGIFWPEPVADLNSIIHVIRDDRKQEFCKSLLPLIYGGLLELYGDREGSRRMGQSHNIALTDLFFRQAWSIQHDLQESRPMKPAKLQATLAAMPDEQVKDLLRLAVTDGSYTHPMTGREMQLKPYHSASIVRLLLQRDQNPSPPRVEESGATAYTKKDESRPSDLSGLRPQ